MSHHSQGIIDSLDFDPVLERNGSEGVKLTFTVPADVTGHDAKLSSITLKNLVREARQTLEDRQISEARIEAFLSPVTALVEDSSYWRLQSRGLVVFVAEGFFLPIRVPIELRAQVSVAERFDFLSLAPVIASDRRLYILALAKNSVRLFESTRNVIDELPLENVPASFDEVVEQLPERVIDVRVGSAGTAGTPSFHGPDRDIERQLLEKYLQAVGQAIGTRLGTARSQQLVLAAVAEYLPMFTAACPYPQIFDGVIAGNPERSLPDDLRSAAWSLVNADENSRDAAEEDHARSLAHAGKGSFDLDEIVAAAEVGRVDTLFLPRDEALARDADARDLANRALIDTLSSSGALRTLSTLNGGVLAVFRY